MLPNNKIRNMVITAFMYYRLLMLGANLFKNTGSIKCVFCQSSPCGQYQSTSDEVWHLCGCIINGALAITSHIFKNFQFSNFFPTFALSTTINGGNI